MEFKIVDYRQENLFTWELTVVSTDMDIYKVKVVLDKTDLELYSNGLDIEILEDLRITCGEYLKDHGELIDGEDGDWYLVKDTYVRIFQLPVNNSRIFRGATIEDIGSPTVDLGDYVCVWAEILPGEFEGYLTLEQLYTKFNTNRPYNFGGHSLSVSDIIEVFKADGSSKSRYYYCEYTGWRDITEKIKK